jgi:hypothetical protein
MSISGSGSGEVQFYRGHADGHADGRTNRQTDIHPIIIIIIKTLSDSQEKKDSKYIIHLIIIRVPSTNQKYKVPNPNK